MPTAGSSTETYHLQAFAPVLSWRAYSCLRYPKYEQTKMDQRQGTQMLTIKTTKGKQPPNSQRSIARYEGSKRKAHISLHITDLPRIIHFFKYLTHSTGFFKYGSWPEKQRCSFHLWLGSSNKFFKNSPQSSRIKITLKKTCISL